MNGSSWSGGRGGGSPAQSLALRSRIVLGCAEGLANKEVAAREGVSQPTVGKWRAGSWSCGWMAWAMIPARVGCRR